MMSVCLVWKQVKLIKVGSRMVVLKECKVVMVRTVRGHKVYQLKRQDKHWEATVYCSDYSQ